MSIVTQTSLQPHLFPWEKIDLSPEQLKSLYRDWGNFCARIHQNDKAVRYYNKCLELQDDDPTTLYHRSMCKRDLTQTESALDDGVEAARLDDNNALINYEVCMALYELNQFENCVIELHDNSRKFTGIKVKGFVNKIETLNENFKDSVGDSYGPFALKNGKAIEAAQLQLYKKLTIDERPLWKQQRDQQKCDVLSILEKEDILLSPREMARRKRAFMVLNQLYFGKTWTDVIFLKHLQHNPSLLLSQAKFTSPFLKHYTEKKYAVIKKFLRMLEARSPLYNELLKKFPSKKVLAQQREHYLNRIQYQTRRNMLTILRSVREYRKQGKVERLSLFVEEVMGNYVVLKTFRTMPWKFEFVYEVYQILALAHTDRFIANYYKYGVGKLNKDLLPKLLSVSSVKYKDKGEFTFGDKSTYNEPDAIDYSFLNYKKFVARLEIRMRFAKYCIEKCYLLHEIAKSHLNQFRFDECCSVAGKAVEEAKKCNCTIWQFLSTMLICKAHVSLNKVERTKEVLQKATSIIKKLKSPKLRTFLDTCTILNEQVLYSKKFSQSTESIRRRRSKQSLTSATSLTTSQQQL